MAVGLATIRGPKQLPIQYYCGGSLNIMTVYYTVPSKPYSNYWGPYVIAVSQGLPGSGAFVSYDGSIV